ncbi:LysR family transcriptional regulator, partial [Curvivirga aplysinae]|uniref:LysR family transcriptional regulator n=1 Tax=Curvivirga aplysinae TaxID=2529852 RepID=UPI0012BC223A
LKLLLSIHQSGSFASTARDLSLDPSQISRIVSGLEEELGIRLFQRTTRNLQLTEAGEVYLGRLQSILEDLDQAEDDAKTLSQSPTGKLRLTASIAYGHHMILPLLGKFKTLYPEIDLEIVFSDDNLDLVSDRIDVAIRLAPRIQQDMICSKLHDTNYYIVATSTYLANQKKVTSPETLSEMNAILFNLPDYQSKWLAKDKMSNVKEVQINGDLVLSNAIAIKQAMLADLGIAMLPNWLIEQDIEIGNCQNLLPYHQVTATDFETGAWIIYPSRNFLPTKTRVMIDFLKQELS